MPYREHKPGPELERLVDCWWTCGAGGPGQRVVPDGCIDVIFDLGSNARAFVVGAMSRPVLSGAHGEMVAVRFRPGAGAAVLATEARALRDARVDLSDLWGRSARDLLDRLGDAPDPRARVAILDAAFSARARSVQRPDPRIGAAVTALLSGASSDVAGQVGWSERQLERAFDRWVGVGPKLLARIGRLSRVQRAIDAGAPRRAGWAAVALDLGYCDQAHLARDVAALAGVPPTTLERERQRRDMSVSSKTEPRAASTVAG